MSVLIAAASAVVIMIVAKGVYDLQYWLECSDYHRHFED